jgi:antitoxin component of MazEF toxin-antitoxin module
MVVRVLYVYIIEVRSHAHNSSAQGRRLRHARCTSCDPRSVALEVGATVGLEVDGERLVVKPNIKPRYTLAELLEASDYSQPQPAEEREWIDSPSVGGELI